MRLRVQLNDELLLVVTVFQITSTLITLKHNGTMALPVQVDFTIIII